MARKQDHSQNAKKLWDKIYNGLNGGGYYMYSVTAFEDCKSPEDVIQKFGVEAFVEKWNEGNENASMGLSEALDDCKPGKGGSLRSLKSDQKKLSDTSWKLQQELMKVFPQHAAYLEKTMEIPAEFD